MANINVCAHLGEHCDGAEFCSICRVQIFSGYVYGDERYCNDHKPATYDAEIAKMPEEEFGDQDDMYWTQWEIDDIFCECLTDCPCRPNPTVLKALYDADRLKDGKTYTITQAQLTQISEVLLDCEAMLEILTNGPSGAFTRGQDPQADEEYSRLEDVRKAREEVESILYMNCELCGDLRLEEDLNEDQQCPPCEEREEKNENGI